MLEKTSTLVLYCVLVLALLANIAFDSVLYSLSTMIDTATILVAVFTFWAIQKKTKKGD